MGRNYNNKKGNKKPYNKNGKNSKQEQKKDVLTNDAPAFMKGVVDYDKIKSNDIVWWNQNPIQFDLATRVPAFNRIQGAPYPVGKTLNGYTNNALGADLSTKDNTMPGIMTLGFLPSIGISKKSTDPVNKALNSLMSTLYAKTSGASLQFQQADLVNYCLSLSSMACAFAAVKRMLGCKDFWITRNINYPKLLSSALGNTDYDDMVKNFNSYVSRLNNLIAQFNAIKVPSWFKVFARHYSLAKNIYLDENSDFGQLYAFIPEGIWMYDDSSGECTIANLPDNSDVNAYLNLIEEALGLWLNSSDLYNINGALTRAFPEADFIFIEPFQEYERIDPITDDYLAMQCMNATFDDRIMEMAFGDAGTWKLTQDPAKNIVLFDPYINVGVEPETTPYAPEYVFIRAFKDQPTQEDNMEMTRLTTIFDYDSLNAQEGDDAPFKIKSCGTEVISRVKVYSSSGDIVTIPRNILSTDQVDSNLVYNVIRALSPFRFIPRILIIYSEANKTKFIELGDQYNYSCLSVEDAQRLHETALYSIWKPQIG